MSIDFKEIRELLNAISQADVAEFSLKSEQFELTVRKGVAATPTEAPVQSTPQPTPSQPAPSATTPSEETTTSDSDETEWHNVISPIVGTFYEAPSPGESPFVKVGDHVEAHQIVGIVEAMKIMNEIEADVSGQVMEINVKNGEPVEYGQTLMRIKPD